MYKLFEVFGVELEYMIVDRDTLKVRPIADLLIEEITGSFNSDVDRGMLAWSNELVSHVIELKTNGPVPSLKNLADAFSKEVEFINDILRPHNAQLMPTGAHPFFNPDVETVIWPHEHNEVYALYDRIFGCKGHGWSNLQSTHLNLPFADDDEFSKLHAAIRVLLPIIPGISASTPIIEGKLTGHFDTRLDYYRKNQQRIPEIAGLIVPESVFSKAAYEQIIFDPIKKAIKPYDTDGILDKHFLNSRGAIARFDRGAIEIRVIDIQECPRADLAIIELIVAALQWLIQKHTDDMEKLQNCCSTESLAKILTLSSKYGSESRIEDENYLSIFGKTASSSIKEIWQELLVQNKSKLSAQALHVLQIITTQGNLSERMFSRLAENKSEESIQKLYAELTKCLAQNELFVL